MRDGEALVRRAIELHNEGGEELLERYDDLFVPDAEWTPMTVGAVGAPEGITYRGRDGMARFYAERAEAFERGTVEPLSVDPAGEDALVVRARSTATGRASGAEVDEEITLVYWLREGKIARLRAFRSGQQAREAVHA